MEKSDEAMAGTDTGDEAEAAEAGAGTGRATTPNGANGTSRITWCEAAGRELFLGTQGGARVKYLNGGRAVRMQTSEMIV